MMTHMELGSAMALSTVRTVALPLLNVVSGGIEPMPVKYGLNAQH